MCALDYIGCMTFHIISCLLRFLIFKISLYLPSGTNMASLEPRHIADPAAGNYTQVYHWGYESRILPCMKDPRILRITRCGVLDDRCLDALYIHLLGSHCFCIGCIVLRSGIKTFSKGRCAKGIMRILQAWRAVGASIRKWLRSESSAGFFGNVTRQQFLLLAILLLNLLIFA